MKNTLLIKLWLTLIAFGAALGMSAQYIDNLSKIESGKYYRIVNVERGEALAAIDGTNAVKQMPVTLGDRFQRWQITYDETSKLYTLYNEGRKMYLAKPANNNNGTAITTGTTAGKYTIRKTTVTTKEPTYFNILPQGTTTNALNNYGGNTADGSVKLYTANAGGEWQIAPFDDAEFAEADMFKRGIFRIRNKRINSKYLAENTSTHKLVGEGKKPPALAITAKFGYLHPAQKADTPYIIWLQDVR